MLSLVGTIGIPPKHRLAPSTIEFALEYVRTTLISSAKGSLDSDSKLSKAAGSQSNSTKSSQSDTFLVHELWNLSKVLLTGHTEHVKGVPASDFEGFDKTRGWGEPPTELAVIPVSDSESNDATSAMVFIVGLNSRRPWDEDHIAWIESMRISLSTLLTAVTTKEANFKRSEQLTQLDAAKTHFFSNVSHELRETFCSVLLKII